MEVPMQITELCERMNITIPETLQNAADTEINLLTCASSNMRKDDVYFARFPSREEELVRNAFAAGAIAAVTRKQYEDEDGTPLPCIITKNPLKDYLSVCASLRDQFHGKLIAITGSLGKTTTKDMLRLVLGKKYKASCSILNRNSLNSVGRGVQRVPSDDEFFVQEVGAGVPRVVEKSAAILRPDAVIITNIGYAHIDKYKSVEAILEDKLSLVREMKDDGVVFLNADNELLMGVEQPHRTITFGMNNPEADYRAVDITAENETLHFNILHDGVSTPVILHSMGVHNVLNATAAFAAAHWAGMSSAEIQHALLDYYSYGIHQNYVRARGNTLYIDCFSNTVESLAGTIEVTEKLAVPEGRKRIAVIGDIQYVSDDDKDFYYKKVGKTIGESSINQIICFGNDAEETARAISPYHEDVKFTDSRSQLNEWLEEAVAPGDLVVFKAPISNYMSKTIDEVFGTSFHFHEGGERSTRNLQNFRVLFLGDDKRLKRYEDSTDLSIIAYKGKDKTVSIPEYFEGRPPVAIQRNAFKGNRTVRSVQIPATVYNIGREAFAGCGNLKEIQLPEDLRIIESKAFSGCGKLKSIRIPNGVTDIQDRAFADCRKLEEVHLPDSIMYMGNNVFSESPKVKVISSNPVVLDYIKKNME